MDADGTIRDRVPFGPHHDRLLGRFLYVQYRVVRGFVFAVALFLVVYVGPPPEVTRLHVLVFVVLWLIGMEGSVGSREERIARYVMKRTGRGDVPGEE